MEHHFNVELASKYGVNEAIFCHNIYFWVKQNKANKRNFHKDTYWTYNSMDAYQELFPYWTRRQVEHLIKKCRDKGLIITDNFNKSPYDRTLWYAVTEKVVLTYEPNNHNTSQKCEMRKTNLWNENHKNVTPIPDSKPDSKPEKEEEEEEDIITFGNVMTFISEQITKREITNPKTKTAIFEVAAKCKAIGTTDFEAMQNYCITIIEEKMKLFGQKQSQKQPRKGKTTVRKEHLPEWFAEQGTQQAEVKAEIQPQQPDKSHETKQAEINAMLKRLKE